VEFIASAWDEWQAVEPGAEVLTGPSCPATFALEAGITARLAARQGGLPLMDLSAHRGRDAAALGSVNCALSAAQAVAEEARASFALCRPPGHHAGKSNCGGYCYFNNAAIAANWLCGKGKVALLDIDYHAGNGTQEIFYERRDVLSISIHADPAFEYPYFAGYPEQRGIGQGEGFHHNFPLPAGTDDTSYLAALDEALEAIRRFEASYLVISAGMDICAGDPLGRINVTREGVGEIGRRISSLDLPAVIVMEGGYNNDALGATS
jgi:acetoin utilization deacetylase AcuC-like enzyme